jgi:hypothetical protein
MLTHFKGTWIASASLLFFERNSGYRHMIVLRCICCSKSQGFQRLNICKLQMDQVDDFGAELAPQPEAVQASADEESKFKAAVIGTAADWQQQ